MTYNISKTSGGIISIPDNTVDTTSTSISLVGVNTTNFGVYINQNFLNILQNFAANAAPINPLIGQVWYDTVPASLKYYNGTQWKILTPPFDSSSGTATASISGHGIAFGLAGNQIIYAVSEVALPAASLPATITIDDSLFAVAGRFPHGFGPGITLATDQNGMRYWGIAEYAEALSTPMKITLSGSASGSVVFDGSSNVTLPVHLNSVVSAGTYTKVTVSSNGIVTTGSTINADDVIAALGYKPGTLDAGTTLNLTGAVIGSGIIDGGTTTINTTFGSAYLPPLAIISVPVCDALPYGWYICNGQNVVISDSHLQTIPNLSTSNLPGCIWVIKVF